MALTEAAFSAAGILGTLPEREELLRVDFVPEELALFWHGMELAARFRLLRVTAIA